MGIGGFDIAKEEIEDGIKIIAKGHINALNSTRLQYDLDEAVGKGFNNIILNMAQVDFLSSSGIRVILKTFKTMERSGGKFRIERPSENVRNVLGITALDGMLLK